MFSLDKLASLWLRSPTPQRFPALWPQRVGGVWTLRQPGPWIGTFSFTGTFWSIKGKSTAMCDSSQYKTVSWCHCQNISPEAFFERRPTGNGCIFPGTPLRTAALCSSCCLVWHKWVLWKSTAHLERPGTTSGQLQWADRFFSNGASKSFDRSHGFREVQIPHSGCHLEVSWDDSSEKRPTESWN